MLEPNVSIFSSVFLPPNQDRQLSFVLLLVAVFAACDVDSYAHFDFVWGLESNDFNLKQNSCLLVFLWVAFFLLKWLIAFLIQSYIKYRPLFLAKKKLQCFLVSWRYRLENFGAGRWKVYHLRIHFQFPIRGLASHFHNLVVVLVQIKEWWQKQSAWTHH